MTRPDDADRDDADRGGAASSVQPDTATPWPGVPVGSPGPGHRDHRNTVFLVVGLFVAFALAGFFSGYASSSPDGLEKVAEDKGFIQQTDDHSFADWPLADYAVSGIGNERLAGGVAGVIGVSIAYVVCAAVALGITRLRVRSRAAAAPEGDRMVEAAGTGSAPRP